jgi:hypothetical protein
MVGHILILGSSTADYRLAVGRSILLATLLTARFVPPATAQEQTGNERALWRLWQVQDATPHDHTAVLAACQAFKQAHPEDAFLVLTETLQAWHLLKLGRTVDAVAMLEAVAQYPAGPLTRGGQALAAAWLTRVDRERVKQALQVYYRREIGYPPALSDLAAYEALPEALVFPLQDRWQRPWHYRLIGYRRLSGLQNQKYELQSVKLGARSDLTEALSVPYGQQITMRPTRILSGVRGRGVVEMEILPPPGAVPLEGQSLPAGERVQIGVQAWVHGVFLAHVGQHLILVCDRSHWKVFPKPGAGR